MYTHPIYKGPTVERAVEEFLAIPPPWEATRWSARVLRECRDHHVTTVIQAEQTIQLFWVHFQIGVLEQAIPNISFLSLAPPSPEDILKERGI